jgi:hypothetical protein
MACFRLLQAGTYAWYYDIRVTPMYWPLRRQEWLARPPVSKISVQSAVV